MRRKRLVNAAQNAALILLVLSAVFLVTRLSIFRGNWAAGVQNLLAPRQPGSAQQGAGELEDVFPSVHLVVTGERTYGRYSQLYVEAGDTLLQQAAPLFREALGSAVEAGVTADRTLRQALDSPSLYLDLTAVLPLSVVAAWLGESVDFDRDVRALALAAEGGDTASLYLCGGDGEVFRCYTMLPASAVPELCGSWSPNGGGFACDAGYEGLAPYTVLSAGTAKLADMRSDLPAGCSAYNLLTALDFNAHTLSRYNAGGVEVVEQSPRTLRISPDGTVGFTSRSGLDLPLYRVSAAGGTPTALEALYAARALARVLTEGTGASPLYLQAVEAAGDGWRVRFRYQAAGVPVRFADEADALSVTVSGTAVAAFTYRCRSYTALEESTALLPPMMAAAIADPDGGGLDLGYVDDAWGRLSARWLER